jgi:hypothetical protein
MRFVTSERGPLNYVRKCERKRGCVKTRVYAEGVEQFQPRVTPWGKGTTTRSYPERIEYDFVDGFIYCFFFGSARIERLCIASYTQSPPRPILISHSIVCRFVSRGT